MSMRRLVFCVAVMTMALGAARASALATVTVVPATSGPVFPGDTVSVDIVLEAPSDDVSSWSIRLSSNGTALLGFGVSVVGFTETSSPVPSGGSIGPFAQLTAIPPGQPVNAVIGRAEFQAGEGPALLIGPDAFSSTVTQGFLDPSPVPTSYVGASIPIVPEPTTGLLLGAGLAALALRRRRT